MERRTFIIVAWCALTLIAAVAPVRAADTEEARNYLRVGPGVTLQENADLEEFLSENVTGAEVEFSPGAGISLAAGRNFLPWLALEFETGLMNNWLDSVNRPNQGDLGLMHIPFMLNAVVQWPNRTGFIPFAGVGGGGASTILYADDFRLGNTWIDGSEGSVNYAYQGFGGLRYKFNSRSGIVFAYKYSTVGEQEFSPNQLFGTAGNIRFGETHQHTFVLQYMLRF